MWNEISMALMNLEFKAKQRIIEFVYDEDGEVNIIAMIVLLAIAIALAVVFREYIIGLFKRIWGAINSSADNAIAGY